MLLAGTQYKVTVDDMIVTERINGVEVGTTVRSESVLLVGSKGATVIGQPLVKDAFVDLAVEEHPLADKVIIFKKIRRKQYKRWKGYRAQLTVLRVLRLGFSPEIDEQIKQADAAATAPMHGS